MHRGRGRLGPVALVCAGAVAILWVGWTCPMRVALGVPCPTCGVTRATRLLLHGEWAAATSMHPLVWLVVPVTGALLGIELYGYLRAGVWGASSRTPYTLAVLIGTTALLFALWVARFCGAFGGPVQG